MATTLCKHQPFNLLPYTSLPSPCPTSSSPHLLVWRFLSMMVAKLATIIKEIAERGSGLVKLMFSYIDDI
jgi:hypothetical protein